MQPDPENLRVEYAATNDSYMHYDAFRWQAGSFLIAGVFIFWGLLIQQKIDAPWVIVTASLLVTALMSIWLLFAFHYRQIYLWKLHRLWELESLLGGSQHTRFRRIGKRAATYDIQGPRGHHLDIVTYVITSLGSIALGVARNGFKLEFLVAIAPIPVVVAWVLFNDRAFHRLQDRLDRGAGADLAQA